MIAGLRCSGKRRLALTLNRVDLTSSSPVSRHDTTHRLRVRTKYFDVVARLTIIDGDMRCVAESATLRHGMGFVFVARASDSPDAFIAHFKADVARIEAAGSLAFACVVVTDALLDEECYACGWQAWTQALSSHGALPLECVAWRFGGEAFWRGETAVPPGIEHASLLSPVAASGPARVLQMIHCTPWPYYQATTRSDGPPRRDVPGAIVVVTNGTSSDGSASFRAIGHAATRPGGHPLEAAVRTISLKTDYRAEVHVIPVLKSVVSAGSCLWLGCAGDDRLFVLVDVGEPNEGGNGGEAAVSTSTEAKAAASSLIRRCFPWLDAEHAAVVCASGGEDEAPQDGFEVISCMTQPWSSEAGYTGAQRVHEMICLAFCRHGENPVINHQSSGVLPRTLLLTYPNRLLVVALGMDRATSLAAMALLCSRGTESSVSSTAEIATLFPSAERPLARLTGCYAMTLDTKYYTARVHAALLAVQVDVVTTESDWAALLDVDGIELFSAVVVLVGAFGVHTASEIAHMLSAWQQRRGEPKEADDGTSDHGRAIELNPPPLRASGETSVIVLPVADESSLTSEAIRCLRDWEPVLFDAVHADTLVVGTIAEKVDRCVASLECHPWPDTDPKAPPTATKNGGVGTAAAAASNVLGCEPPPTMVFDTTTRRTVLRPSIVVNDDLDVPAFLNQALALRNDRGLSREDRVDRATQIMSQMAPAASGDGVH